MQCEGLRGTGVGQKSMASTDRMQLLTGVGTRDHLTDFLDAKGLQSGLPLLATYMQHLGVCTHPWHSILS